MLPVHINFEGENEMSLKVQTEYGVARFVVGCLNLFGWLFILLGALVLLFGVASAMAESEYGDAPLILILASAAGCVFFGLLYIAGGQFLRATLDSADYNRETWQILSSRGQAALTYGERPSTF